MMVRAEQPCFVFILNGLLCLQRKPPSKRGPPTLQKRLNVTVSHLKDRGDPVVEKEADGGTEAKTVIRCVHHITTRDISYRRILILLPGLVCRYLFVCLVFDLWS